MPALSLRGIAALHCGASRADPRTVTAQNADPLCDEEPTVLKMRMRSATATGRWQLLRGSALGVRVDGRDPAVLGGIRQKRRLDGVARQHGQLVP